MDYKKWSKNMFLTYLKEYQIEFEQYNDHSFLLVKNYHGTYYEFYDYKIHFYIEEGKIRYEISDEKMKKEMDQFLENNEWKNDIQIFCIELVNYLHKELS